MILWDVFGHSPQSIAKMCSEQLLKPRGSAKMQSSIADSSEGQVSPLAHSGFKELSCIFRLFRKRRVCMYDKDTLI